MEDFLSYIMPAGYTYSIGTTDPREIEHEIVTDNTFIDLVNPTISNSQVRGVDRYMYNGNANDNPYQFRSDLENRTVGMYTATEVIGSNNYLTQTPFDEDITGSIRDAIDKSENATGSAKKENTDDNE